MDVGVTGDDAEPTIDRHLAAVANRDLESYAATIHPDLAGVIPSGRVLRGAEEVVAFHRERFAGDDWTYRAKPLRST